MTTRTRRVGGMIAVMAVLLSGCGREVTQRPTAASSDATSVSVARVELITAPRLIRVRGVVRGERSAAIASRVGGRVEGVAVRLGERVEAGALVARLSAGELPARLDAARARRNEIERELARERQLLAGDATTERAARVLEDRLAAAIAEERELLHWLSELEVRAPFAGTVGQLPAEVGAALAPGSPVAVIDSGESMEAVIAVPVDLAAGLVPGAPLSVLGEVSAGVEATVKAVAARASSTRTIEVRLDLPTGRGWIAGDELVVGIPGETVRQLLVPANAVRRDGSLETVFVARADGLAELRLVRTGGTSGPSVVVLAGLAEGENVVVESEAPLVDGARVVATGRSES